MVSRDRSSKRFANSQRGEKSTSLMHSEDVLLDIGDADIDAAIPDAPDAPRSGAGALLSAVRLAHPATSDRNDGSLLAPLQSCRNLASNGFRSPPKRIIVEVCIACGRRRLSVTEQSADDRQSQSATRPEACKGVSQIVQADAAQAGALANGVPGALQIVAWLIGNVACYHVRAYALQSVKHGEGRSIEDDRLLTTLAVRQK